MRCYGNITRTRNVSEYVLALALWLVCFGFGFGFATERVRLRAGQGRDRGAEPRAAAPAAVQVHRAPVVRVPARPRLRAGPRLPGLRRLRRAPLLPGQPGRLLSGQVAAVQRLPGRRSAARHAPLLQCSGRLPASHFLLLTGVSASLTLGRVGPCMISQAVRGSPSIKRFCVDLNSHNTAY